MKTAALLCVVVMCLAMVPMAFASPAEATYAISIDGDADLIAQAEVNGWPGTGSADDPVLISGMDFSAAYSEYALYVGNTTLHLTLRNCNFTEQSSSVVFFSTSNISIEGCRFQNCYLGIGGLLCTSIEVLDCTFSCTLGAVVMVNCSDLRLVNNEIQVLPGNDGSFLSGLSLQNCTGLYTYHCNFVNGTNLFNSCSEVQLYGCSFTDCTDGLTIAGSDHVVVANSTWSNGRSGIVLGDNSTNVYLQSNTMNGCGIRFDATDEATYATLVMESVTVGGRPFLFLKDIDEHGASIITNAQQALLFRVSNAILLNAVQTQSNGITLAFCTSVVVRNCTATDFEDYGVRMVQSLSCLVRNCTFNGGRLGVELLWSGTQNRVEGNRFVNCSMGVGVYWAQDQPEVNGNTFEACSIGIILGGAGAFASDNVLANCSGGAIALSSGLQSVMIGNKISGGGYGIRMGDNNDTLVQLNEIKGALVGIILDGGNVATYITDNLVTNCSSHAVRCYGEGNGTFIAQNRFLSNNGAGPVYSPSHVQASDGLGFATWNLTWGNYWSDWTSTSYDIGAYNISSAAKDLKPYPLLVCGAPDDLKGKFTANNLTITWAAPTYPGFESASSYAIYRGDSVNNMTRIATVDGSLSSFTDHNLGGGTYYYQISAINSYGEGGHSGVLSTTQGNSNGIDVTLLLIALLVVIVIVIAVLLLRKRR